MNWALLTLLLLTRLLGLKILLRTISISITMLMSLLLITTMKATGTYTAVIQSGQNIDLYNFKQADC